MSTLITDDSRPRPVVFEAKARPLQGQGHDFWSSRSRTVLKGPIPVINYVYTYNTMVMERSRCREQVPTTNYLKTCYVRDDQGLFPSIVRKNWKRQGISFFKVNAVKLHHTRQRAVAA